MSSMVLLTTSYPSEASQLAGNFPRGKFVHDMARGLRANGFEVHVITHREPGEQKHWDLDGVQVHRFNYFFKGQQTLTGGAGIPENIKKIRNLVQVPFYFAALFFLAWQTIRRHKIQYINSHWVFPSGFIGFLLQLITGKTHIITAYGAELFPLQRGKLKFLQPFIKAAVKNAQVVAGISLATVNAVKELTHIEHAEVIPDGIDTEYYRPGAVDSQLIQKYGLSPDKTIFFTGRMVTRKGHRYLLEAMRSVKNEHPDAILLLGGDGPLLPEIRNLLAQWKLQDVVHLPGPIPEADMVPLLRAAALFVLPSCIDSRGDTEGSATAALEAMACGTIALISNVGGNRGSIQEGQGAHYFQPANAADLAEKIISLLDLSALERQKQKTTARAYIENNYRWETIIQHYRRLIAAAA